MKGKMGMPRGFVVVVGVVEMGSFVVAIMRDRNEVIGRGGDGARRMLRLSDETAMSPVCRLRLVEELRRCRATDEGAENEVFQLRNRNTQTRNKWNRKHFRQWTNQDSSERGIFGNSTNRRFFLYRILLFGLEP